MKPERRAFTTELRASGESRTIFGYGAVFNSRTDIGYFTEEIAPGAFAGVLDNDVRGLFNHDPDHILGRTSAGTLRISEDDRGLRFEMDLPDSPIGNTVLEAIRRGDVTGNSFSFTVDEAGEELSVKEGKRHRVIKRVAQLLDVGPVTFPAYDATEVSARCLEWAEREDDTMLAPVAQDFTRERERLRFAENS